MWAREEKYVVTTIDSQEIYDSLDTVAARQLSSEP
jgi:hypothetical protein